MARQQSRRRLVADELLEHAGRLFATKGYANTSFQDIADAMGVSRPALYHYVSNKEEILAALVRDVLERVVEILEESAAREDLDAGERVELALRRIVVNNAHHTSRFRLLDRSEPDLPEEIAEVHRAARRRVLHLLTGMIETAVAAGHFRPLPARTVALAMLGTANWVAWWYRPDHDGDADAVADVLVDVALSGVRRHEGRQVEGGPWAALALLREDISHLETAMTSALRSRDGDDEGGDGA
ncbi:TetR/AcrR family transcriptional regulator [Actinomycetospora lemnae]|uniref:TetR/AcrR family transcriptional regulator n=1 Tax=Actinomycetospora lemnae TaxID=3019891 RepID=A0ABT5STS5_9PSEU|nr:TetR/AcrR family transcriptional regulator [Actinomycetospora sp. DW7H6]MDD7965148.1 TetR/AcrR family transcriptional regulator [Actinomycetospora sp. DW7H6]